MFEQYPDILTVEEACEALRMGYNAVYDLLNEGKLKAYKNGRVWRITKQALIQFRTISKTPGAITLRESF